MKKSAVKAPAKAIKPVKNVSAKSVNKPAAPATKRVAAPAAKALVPSTKAPVVKAASAKSASTEITAVINVGFGNALFLRGEGPGLSWDVGFPLNCVSDETWSVSFPATGKAITYKLLINDTTWSTCSDYVAASGSKVTVEPTF